ncbi:hypothetical protein SAMN06265365_13053 [Tistlia consotensis]|uniref:DUF1127 domain-containing protein n=1 Tax=Tistlia consotensis USBA 355 TaxID=560819 RepID=A0A1Y6CLY4_9PROT|nr:hypothetical protein [Tistlia consotensis]SMF72664.1 hypothetical protein SAMN05428998_13153 [Tistlia consotensis USBA 355]SNS09649.1 hypothetical protein SAMN06265365_13053 [Tistlia consotensis]
MASDSFTADSTMPGLSGRDLGRRVLALFGRGDAAENSREVALRSLAGLDRRVLRDIGLDRDAA